MSTTHTKIVYKSQPAKPMRESEVLADFEHDDETYHVCINASDEYVIEDIYGDEVTPTVYGAAEFKAIQASAPKDIV